MVDRKPGRELVSATSGKAQAGVTKAEKVEGTRQRGHGLHCSQKTDLGLTNLCHGDLEEMTQ